MFSVLFPGQGSQSLGMGKNLYKKFPIFGICLGHQSIGQAFESEIVQCNKIMHGKISKITHNNHLLFNQIPTTFEATRYHSLIIKKNTLHKKFEIISKTSDNIIMGIAHKEYDLFGLQFHPESIGTTIGKKIIKNFLEIIKYEN